MVKILQHTLLWLTFNKEAIIHVFIPAMYAALWSFIVNFSSLERKEKLHSALHTLCNPMWEVEVGHNLKDNPFTTIPFNELALALTLTQPVYVPILHIFI